MKRRHICTTHAQIVNHFLRPVDPSIDWEAGCREDDLAMVLKARIAIATAPTR